MPRTPYNKDYYHARKEERYETAVEIEELVEAIIYFFYTELTRIESTKVRRRRIRSLHMAIQCRLRRLARPGV